MDYLHISELNVKGVHGYYEHEWLKPQSFSVSLKVGIDTAKSASLDALTETIDYDTLRSAVETVFAGARSALIETLANAIAETILQNPRALEVQVTIHKLDVWDNGVPGVTITRNRTK